MSWLIYCFSQFPLFPSLWLPDCSMANQPVPNAAQPPNVNIRGQPVAQNSGCCSS